MDFPHRDLTKLFFQHMRKADCPHRTAFICEYLGVTPQEFFDEGNANPEALNEFIAQARQLDSRSFEYILGIMKELNTKR